MHPIFSSGKTFLAYVGAWIPLSAMLGLLIATTGDLRAAECLVIILPVAVVLSFACLSPRYTCRSLPLRSTTLAKLIGQHVLAAIVLAGVVLGVARLGAFGFSGIFPGLAERFAKASPVLTAMVALIYLLFVALHYMVIEAQNSRQSELLAREAQLRALKAQVNPHFLFNSLNSISALTSVDPVRAREMCIRLADFLRVSLRLGERDSIPFGEEMELTRMYLEVEQVRFGGKLRVSRDVQPECGDCEVPALLIQPLVENAVKHGIALLDEGGEILIRTRRGRDSLQFTIENPFDPEAPAGRSGIGLANVRKRLEARYGQAGSMEIAAEERLYRVTLTLPMRTL